MIALIKEWPTGERTTSPPACGHRLCDMARGDQVRDDGGTLLARLLSAGHLAAGDERGDRGGRHQGSGFVQHHAAVGVAVEGEAEVRSLAHHGGLQVVEVLTVQGVGGVVREGPVELEVQREQLQLIEASEHGGRRVARHGVGGIDDEAQRALGGDRDEIVEGAGVVRQRVQHLDPALAGRGDLARCEVGLGAAADLVQAACHG